MKSFNVLDRHLNVHESYLLEASAGTGKTFSIENIVVRMLIGEKQVLLNEILVVTFTKAAAADLKTRIRQNIQKALRFFEGGSLKAPDYIEAVLEQGEKATSNAIEKLKAALFTFDQAEIFTIHSFCFKMLKTHALESGISLSAHSEGSSLQKSDIIKVIRNFFRAGLKPELISPQQFNIVLKKELSSIENLEKSLLKSIERGFEIVSGKNFQELFLEFKEKFKTLSFEKEKILADYALQIPYYTKTKDRDQGQDKVLRFAELFQKKELTPDDFDLLIKDGLHLVEAFRPSLLRKKVDLQPVREKLFYKDLNEQLEMVIYPIVEEARSYPAIFATLVASCQEMVKQYGEAEELFSFDDLLKWMGRALNEACFLSAVRNKYKAGIIDEFQDTDPVQWEIFRKIFYGVHPFYLVGDPKQSIYAFRQADIYTYLKAKELIAEENQRSLDTNFRSHPPLVHALNRLFQAANDWIQLPRLKTFLPYREVNAAPKKEIFNFTDGLASLHFFIAEEEGKNKWKIKELEESFYFPFIYSQIQSLKKQGVPLSEIAILVKDHFQADRMAFFLKEKNVKAHLQRVSSLATSSYLLKLQELLEAVLTPKDESRLKLALGGPFICFSHEEILAIDDPFKLEELLSRFFHFRHLFYTQGFLSFFEAFLKSSWKESSLAERLLGEENGEDIYLTLLQMGEILAEEEAKEHLTPEKLLQFLKNFEALDFDGDSRLKRWKVEKSEAVQILTIHSSKGLEFDVVFPLGLLNESPDVDPLIPVMQEEKMVLMPVCRQEEAHLSYKKELNAEKMRQLYVAMTRSRYRLYVPVAFLSKEKDEEDVKASCMELFLGKLGVKSKAELIEKLAALDISYSDSTFLKPIENHEKEREVECVLKAPEIPSFSFEPIHTHSFTGLAKKIDIEKKGVAPRDFLVEEKTVHTLPSSAKTGILLHKILEAFPFKKYVAIKEKEELEAFLEPFIYGGSFHSWKSVIAEIIFNVMQINFGTFHFKDIDFRATHSEKEFLYLYSQGLMMGVIDFMFMHEGKYYFIDWKSNWLGGSYSDYTRDLMKSEMERHDYFLQSEIYTEAIKRFLKAVEERDVEECFGGVYYVFLRGLNGVEETGIYRLE